jgi:hypothetical protein
MIKAYQCYQQGKLLIFFCKSIVLRLGALNHLSLYSCSGPTVMVIKHIELWNKKMGLDYYMLVGG